MNTYQNLNAILKEDMETFLEKTGELQKIYDGERFCCICGIKIELNNLQLIVPNEKKEFLYVCDSNDCNESFNYKSINQ